MGNINSNRPPACSASASAAVSHTSSDISFPARNAFCFGGAREEKSCVEAKPAGRGDPVTEEGKFVDGQAPALCLAEARAKLNRPADNCSLTSRKTRFIPRSQIDQLAARVVCQKQAAFLKYFAHRGDEKSQAVRRQLQPFAGRIDHSIPGTVRGHRHCSSPWIERAAGKDIRIGHEARMLAALQQQDFGLSSPCAHHDGGCRKPRRHVERSAHAALSINVALTSVRRQTMQRAAPNAVLPPACCTTGRCGKANPCCVPG